MSSSIVKILKSNYADGLYHTHVSMVQPKGKFYLSREKLEEFWEIYCDAIHNNDETIVGVAEKPQECLPVLVDIDIKLKETDDLNINRDNKKLTT